MRNLSTLVIVIAMSLAFVSAGPAAMAATATVVDDAGFFSADAVATANEQLAEVERKTRTQLRIETHDQIPPEMRGSYDHARRAEFFADWARQRGRESGVVGAIVLINREPAYVQVLPGQQVTRSGVFTAADRDRMRDLLVGAFQAKNYDQGLLKAVELWREKLLSSSAAAAAPRASGSTPEPYRFPGESDAGRADAPSPTATPAPAPAPVQHRRGIGFGTILFWAVLIFGGLWLLRRLLGARRQFQRPGDGQPRYDPRTGAPMDPNYDPRYGGGGYGGGAFGRGVGGGILGGLLGSWMGHTMFGHGGSSAHGSPTGIPPTDPNATGGGAFDEPPSTDFSGPADFGGGGDFGGGDFGGGDAGGGGDF